MNEEQIRQLEQLSREQLCVLVMSVYGIDRQIDQSIETALLADDTDALGRHLKKRIQSIGRSHRFIDYAESNAFSATLDLLVADIEKLVPDDPKLAYTLVDSLMNIHGKVFDRCDDSNGSVGDTFRNGASLWVEAAAAWQNSGLPCKKDWASEVIDRHTNNDYGMWDNLIAQSLPLLGEDTLRSLATQFESELVARQQLKGYDPTTATARIGLKGVAEALSDVHLFERSYIGAEPNELQKEVIVKFCLNVGDGESALKWLDGTWSDRFVRNQQDLLDEAYQLTGQNDVLLSLRTATYLKTPNYENLQALLAIAPEEEQRELKANASRLASESDDIYAAVQTLLKLDDASAASAYVLEHPERLQQVDYYTLSRWAGVFEELGMALPAVLAYRVLLCEILEEGRSKAYRHAANYYEALDRLNDKVTDYQLWPNSVEFRQALKAQHGRKSSFWGRVE